MNGKSHVIENGLHCRSGSHARKLMSFKTKERRRLVHKAHFRTKCHVNEKGEDAVFAYISHKRRENGSDWTRNGHYDVCPRRRGSSAWTYKEESGTLEERTAGLSEAIHKGLREFKY